MSSKSPSTKPADPKAEKPTDPKAEKPAESKADPKYKPTGKVRVLAERDGVRVLADDVRVWKDGTA